MFTGLVEEIGVLDAIRRSDRSAVLVVRAGVVLAGLRQGDSLAVNGVCLTVTSMDRRGFCADMMPETMERSTLGFLRVGGRLNLERAMRADGRFGGHMMTGHVDGTGRVMALRHDGNAVRCTIAASGRIIRRIVEQGSIAVDGISFTVASPGAESFDVSVIPHTARATNFST